MYCDIVYLYAHVPCCSLTLILFSQSGLRGGSAGVVVEALSSRYLDWSNQIGGIQRARAVYKRSAGSCVNPHRSTVCTCTCMPGSD